MSDPPNLARELQRLSGGAVSYRACKLLLEERGYEAAKEQVIRWREEADAEIQRLKGRAVKN